MDFQEDEFGYPAGGYRVNGAGRHTSSVLEGLSGSLFHCAAEKTPRSSKRDTAWAMSQENVELTHRAYEAFNRLISRPSWRS